MTSEGFSAATNTPAGLPAAGTEAKRIVMWQLLSGLAQGLIGVLRFPLFLLRRHAISANIARIIQDESESSMKSELE